MKKYNPDKCSHWIRQSTFNKYSGNSVTLMAHFAHQWKVIVCLSNTITEYIFNDRASAVKEYNKKKKLITKTKEF